MTGVVDDIVTVDDTTLLRATRLLWQTLRLAIEPAGAAGIAALLAHPQLGHGRTIATPLCGANITVTQAQQWLLRSP
jgi:threonine dehydratase